MGNGTWHINKNVYLNFINFIISVFHISFVISYWWYLTPFDCKHPWSDRASKNMTSKNMLYKNSHFISQTVYILSSWVAWLKDTSTPPGWCRPCVWGCWGWGRTEPLVACCWRYCPVFYFWHIAAASSVPTLLLGWWWMPGQAGSEERAAARGHGPEREQG